MSSSDDDMSTDGFGSPPPHRPRSPPGMIDMSQHLLDIIEKNRRIEDQYKAMQDERDYLRRHLARLRSANKKLQKRNDILEGTIVDLRVARKEWREDKAAMESRYEEVFSELLAQQKEGRELHKSLAIAKEALSARSSVLVSCHETIAMSPVGN